MRRLEVEEVLGRVPMPDIGAGKFLVDILFQVGPTRADGPLEESALEPWERRRGIELAPWHADAILAMSRAYMAESHRASHWNAFPPWPPAVKMWKYVRDHKNAPALKAGLKEPIKEHPRNGNRQ